MSILVIFGAGASYGSGCDYPEKPPLGYELFGRISQANKYTILAESRYKGNFEDNFEQAILKLREDRDIDESWVVHAMGDYLRKLRINPNNCYLPFIAGLANLDKKVVLVTANYDLLIEQALSHLGHKWDYVLSENSTLHFTLLKIHGSCNFFIQTGGYEELPQNISGLNLDKAELGGVDFSNLDCKGTSFDQATFDASVKAVVDLDELEEFYKKGSPIIPVMAQYDPNKTAWAGASFIKGIQDSYHQIVKDYDLIIVIGLAYQSHDEHIWSPLKQSKSMINIVDPYPSDELNKWCDLRGSRTRIIKEGFDKFTDNIISL